jgi:hypothetical protein
MTIGSTGSPINPASVKALALTIIGGIEEDG